MSLACLVQCGSQNMWIESKNSPQGLNFSGYRPGIFAQKITFSLLFSVDTNPGRVIGGGVVMVIWTAISQGRAAKVVLSNYKKDGTRFFSELQISAVRDAEGTPTHLVGIQTYLSTWCSAFETRGM
jgi:hypothetical protein